jgi:flagellar motor switch protein FliN
MNAAAKPETFRARYAAVWAEALAVVTGQIVGQARTYEAAPLADEAAAGTAESFWVIVRHEGGLRGEMSIRLNPGDAAGLAGLLLGETAPAAVTPAEAVPGEVAPGEAIPAVVPLLQEQKEAAEEFLRQVVGHVATAVRALAGEVQLQVAAAEGRPTWAVAAAYALVPGESTAARLELRLSAALEATQPVAATPPAVPAAAPVAAVAAPAAVAGATASLDPFLDVAMELTLHFGECRMRLEEVLELSAGAVVEMNRRVQEPVELRLEGRLLARGEVVVVDGCYGVRITEVATGPRH